MDTTEIFKTEDDLVKGLKNHPEQALATLYDRYASSLYGYILKRISEDKADLVLEDIFFLILKMIDVFDSSKSTFFTWVMKITRLHVGAMAANNSFSVIPDQSSVPVLPDDMQLVFMLVYYQDYSIEDVSKAIGIPVEVIASLLRKAIFQLKLL